MATNWIGVWLGALLVVAAVDTQPWPWKPREFSSLWSKVCFNVSHVCDPDGLLTGEQSRQLTEQLSSEGKSGVECDQHISIGVALAQQTFQQTSLDRDQSLDDFADDVRQKWNLSECQNDLVIFIANDSLEIGFSLGNTSLSILGPAFEELAQSLKKDFQTKPDFFHFTSDAARRLTTLYNQRSQISGPLTTTWNILMTIGYLVAILAIIAIVCYYCCYKKGEKTALDATSVISSEMTTKYSELRPTIELNERSTQG